MQMKTFMPAAAAILTGALLASALASTLAQAMPGDHLSATEYGKIGNWTLRVAKSPSGKTEICDAYTIAGSERALRIEFTAGSMVLAFNGLASVARDEPTDVEVWFDNNRAESTIYKMSQVTDATGYTWRGLTQTTDEPSGLLDMFSNLSSIHFAYMVPGSGPHTETFPLEDTNKVVKKTLACIQGG